MKIILSALMVATLLFANQEEPTIPLEAQAVIDKLKEAESPHKDKVDGYLNEMANSNNLNNPEVFFDNLQKSISELDTDGGLKERFAKELEEKEKKALKSFTIFYFISENTSKKLIKNFTYDIKKLQEIDSSIDFLLLTRGLIGGDFETMANYVKSLKEHDIEKMELGFNPWAYEHFDLKEVPAYALSYCEADYKFETCKHKYLVRGEMSLANFFELVSDKEEMYKKHYFKLIDAE